MFGNRKALERMEAKLDTLLERLDGQSGTPEEKESGEWLQSGIDNIMSFQAGNSRKEE